MKINGSDIRPGRAVGRDVPLRARAASPGLVALAGGRVLVDAAGPARFRRAEQGQ